MKKLLTAILGNRKDGKCRSWQHEYKWDSRIDIRNTGEFINGQPIQKKYEVYIGTCKCGDTIRGFEYRINY